MTEMNRIHFGEPECGSSPPPPPPVKHCCRSSLEEGGGGNGKGSPLSPWVAGGVLGEALEKWKGTLRRE